MEAKYQAYPEYKNSRISWVGRIPEHWLLIKGGYIGELFGSETINEKHVSDKGTLPLIKVSDLSLDSFSSKSFSWFVSKVKAKSCKSNKNYVVFPKRGAAIFTNKVNIIKVDSIIDPNLMGWNIFDIAVTEYVAHLLKTRGLEDIADISTVPQINNKHVEPEKFPIPPIIEQYKIVSFLDHETAKIDTLIEKQQQLIKLLKEKRQAVISHAVTKGLDPDVPMRDSGVEWLGEVPEYWVVGNLMHALSAIGDVDHYMPESVDQGIPYVMTGDLKELASNINFDNCKQVSQNDYVKLSKKIKSSKGDVIMARYATIGTASYIDVNTDFLVSYSCVTIKPDLAKVVGLYLFYYFKSDAFLRGIQNQVNTNTQGNVGVHDLKKVKVALPPLVEQHKLIDSLQSKITELDKISARSVAAVKLMQERRTALISAAVTGKIDVRNWQPPSNSLINNHEEVLV